MLSCKMKEDHTENINKNGEEGMKQLELVKQLWFYSIIRLLQCT